MMMNYFMSLNMYLIVLMMGPKDAETLKDIKTLMKPNMMNKLTKNYMFKSFEETWSLKATRYIISGEGSASTPYPSFVAFINSK